MNGDNFSSWFRNGTLSLLGIGLLAAVILRTGFGLPFTRVAVPIAVLVTIQITFFSVMYWARQPYKRKNDLRVGIVVFGTYGLLMGLAGMYYAAQLGLVSPNAVKENYFGFSIFMVVVIVVGVGLFSYWKPSEFKQ
jgi:hypothetical protein